MQKLATVCRECRDVRLRASVVAIIIHTLPEQRVLTITGAIVSNATNIAGLTLTDGPVTGAASCPQSCGGGL